MFDKGILFNQAFYFMGTKGKYDVGKREDGIEMDGGKKHP
jgi:hypothetical protein